MAESQLVREGWGKAKRAEPEEAPSEAPQVVGEKGACPVQERRIEPSRVAASVSRPPRKGPSTPFAIFAVLGAVFVGHTILGFASGREVILLIVYGLLWLGVLPATIWIAFQRPRGIALTVAGLGVLACLSAFVAPDPGPPSKGVKRVAVAVAPPSQGDRDRLRGLIVDESILRRDLRLLEGKSDGKQWAESPRLEKELKEVRKEIGTLRNTYVSVGSEAEQRARRAGYDRMLADVRREVWAEYGPPPRRPAPPRVPQRSSPANASGLTSATSLGAYSNGHDWRRTSYTDRMAFCEEVAKRLRHEGYGGIFSRGTGVYNAYNAFYAADASAVGMKTNLPDAMLLFMAGEKAGVGR